MRKRDVGGYEPDDAEQAELVELWHISRTALAGQVCDRGARIYWCVDQFLDKHQNTPNMAGKWVHNWAVSNLGLITSSSPLLQHQDETIYHDPFKRRR